MQALTKRDRSTPAAKRHRHAESHSVLFVIGTLLVQTKMIGLRDQLALASLNTCFRTAQEKVGLVGRESDFERWIERLPRSKSRWAMQNLKFDLNGLVPLPQCVTELVLKGGDLTTLDALGDFSALQSLKCFFCENFSDVLVLLS